MKLYGSDYRYGDADFEIPLSSMQRAGGDMPTWSFLLENVPVDTYQVVLLPFQKNWLLELPSGGRGDFELVVPELAEIVVEAVALLQDVRLVRPSSGHAEKRHVIVTELELMGERWEVELTLTSRDAMGFRMLLGRQAMRRRFVVDPGRSFLGAKAEARRRYGRTTRRKQG